MLSSQAVPRKDSHPPQSWCEVAHVHVAEWYHSLEWTLNWTLLSELHVEIPIPETQLLCSFCVWDFLRWLTKTMRSMSSPSRAWHQGWDVGLELVTWRHFECRPPQPVSEAFLTFWIGPCPVCYVWIFLLKRMNWPPSYTCLGANSYALSSGSRAQAWNETESLPNRQIIRAASLQISKRGRYSMYTCRVFMGPMNPRVYTHRREGWRGLAADPYLISGILLSSFSRNVLLLPYCQAPGKCHAAGRKRSR